VVDAVVEFRVLGPLEVLVDGHEVRVGAGKLRVVLAALLLQAGRPVGVDELVATLWDGAAPADARGTVQKYVMRIRHLLGAGCVRTEPDGYRIEVAPGRLDLQRFTALTAQARRAAAAGNAEEERAALADALALWRDVPPLADVPSESVQRHEVVALVERYLRALDRRIELDLALGRHADVLGELAALVRRHPGQERFWAHRMRALHRSGRQGEALAAYREVAHLLAEELGVDPGAELQAAHREVLRGTPAPPTTPPAPPARPAPPAAAIRQLPIADAGFVGRQGELDAVVAALLDPGSRGAAPVVVTGLAGAGKTALAVHAAHRVAGRFPDGQLFADLRAHAQAPPQDSDAVLARFLRALGLPADALPADPDDRTGAYRSLLADRRVLVVLDGAARPEQVRRLLPGAPGCAVLVTSRCDLAGLAVSPGSHRIELGVLGPADGRALLAAALGRHRVATETPAADELVRACGGHALALRVAAAHLALHPGLGIADCTERLARDGLAALRVDGDGAADVAAAFDRSTRLLVPGHRRLLGALATLPDRQLTAADAATAAGITRAEAAAGLETLAAAGLVQRCPQLRYGLHVLVRRYAAGLREAEEPPARHAGYRLVG
jgi:DNA-binding SARP family transcriptional activator